LVSRPECIGTYVFQISLAERGKQISLSCTGKARLVLPNEVRLGWL